MTGLDSVASAAAHFVRLHVSTATLYLVKHPKHHKKIRKSKFRKYFPNLLVTDGTRIEFVQHVARRHPLLIVIGDLNFYKNYIEQK